MMRFLAVLGAVSLLVCQSAGQDPANADEQEDFDDIYPADRTRGLANLNGLLGNDLPYLHKREVSDRQREIDLAAQQPFYPYGRRTDVPGRPSGFVFGKRGQYLIPGQYQKRELAEVNPYSVAKRDEELTGLDEFEASKRSNPYSLSGIRSLSFGKRGDPFGWYSFGKRALGNNFAFGKRGWSSFDFGKRSGLGSSLTFGKRDEVDGDVDRFDNDALMQDEKRSFGSLTFGKRANGLSSFTFGKRAGER